MAGITDLINMVLGAKAPQQNVTSSGAVQQMADKLKENTPDYYNKIKKYEGFKNKVYKDTNGIPTIGVGHKILPGEDFSGYKDEDFEKLFVEKDLPKNIKRTKNLINDFEKYPTSVKEEMVASVFRGGLSGSPKTIRLINEGMYKEAAKEFLNNDEYRKAKRWEAKNNKKHGVATRMENLSKELNALK